MGGPLKFPADQPIRGGETFVRHSPPLGCTESRTPSPMGTGPFEARQVPVPFGEGILRQVVEAPLALGFGDLCR